MNKIHKRRLYYVTSFIIGISVALGLMLYALKQNINVFLTPSQITETKVTPDYHFRLGGMVKVGSIQRNKTGLSIRFIVTDLKKELPVTYNGIPPDLFREGKGVIAEGYLNHQGIFVATQVLAKHDENYMPKNVYNIMRAGNEKNEIT